MHITRRKVEHHFKILVIGEASTGKTSFIKRYVHNFYTTSYRATIGVDYAMKKLEYDEYTVIRLSLWDIAGQERFGTLTRAYYREAVGAFIVFDVNSQRTRESVIKWKQDLDRKVSLPDGSPIPCMLLANKCDLVDPNRSEEQVAELDKFALDHGFISCIYTSPKLDINIENAAKMLITEILKKSSIIQDERIRRNNRDGIVSMSEKLNKAAYSEAMRRRRCC